MGFRKDSYATVWEITPRSETMVSGRISINRKDRQTDQYIQDWGGYVAFIGTACAAKAAKLKTKDRIKLGDVDVTNKYDAEKKITYTNFNIYSFEMADGAGNQRSSQPAAPQPSVDDGELSDDLPF